MVRPPCCDKLSVKKGLWTADEDAKILAYVSKHGTGNWTSVPKKAAGLRRCGKSCRLRWTNYLRPDIRHENFTPQEEEMIIRLHAAIGSRWSIIAQQLPGRTDNDVKNYWNTRLRKKLSEMGIDPVTHKPFSQILADYGNIGGIPRSRTRSGSLNRDLKHAFTPRSSPEQMTQLDLNHDKEGIHNQPPDLLAQLQAITLASNRGGGHEIYSPHQFFSECSSSSSAAASPSSSSSTANHGKGGTLGFNWSDFLLEEAFVPETRGDEMENHVDFSPNERERNDLNAHGKQNQEAGEGMDCDRGTIDGSLEASSSSSVKSSFVEAMLGQENDSFLDFCGLLEESYSY